MALAEAGLAYGKDRFDKEWYMKLLEISLSLIKKLDSEIEGKLLGLNKSTGYPTFKVDVGA